MPELLSPSAEIEAYKGSHKVHQVFAIERADWYQMIYASSLLYVLAIFSSKFAVALVFLRIDSSRPIAAIARGIAVACAALGIISVLVIATQQPALYGWQKTGPASAGNTVSIRSSCTNAKNTDGG